MAEALGCLSDAELDEFGVQLRWEHDNGIRLAVRQWLRRARATVQREVSSRPAAKQRVDGGEAH